MKRIFVALLAVSVCACVSTKKYNTLRGDKIFVDDQLSLANDRIAQLSSRNALLGEQNDSLGRLLAQARGSYDSLSTAHAALGERYGRLLADGSAETARMMRQIEASQAELDARSRRIEELNQALAAREKVIEDIRRKVSDALVGFENKGLTISTRGGQVYVSMEDKLLFKSGSYAIDPGGAQAVRDLSNVLATNPDINVLVEGHTDNVPYKGSGELKDNLDLSAKRATTVMRLLLENRGIAPERITAAGRGEWLPIDTSNTSEGRAKNRRTEIILTPKFDELMQIMTEKQ
ncbi:cell envelope biogenesis protein OmpA [Bacteroidia bacterium]|nr:cell envelope biogenesis protein OmpA [Bacteroidia bacterium]